ncbi:MAG: hypothetical protein COZ16_00530 [Flavobacteriaceae bacterium CG_4_10_14_3_um_filter_31_253]|nr:MAG: hypothetical protein AUK46_08615 [Flavobacteriaceae bacterium CG2_30_31_66]PIV95946.1 MAG: hypothetical protein COW43_10820 [Flavobacteriaceae bacterium CG17_big_fil_post_rev_8_21_14_2_50_31_13]PIX13531.1 MAG: hypothetical protein COZ74_05865 [Flavobacteriaceae bacterium CG_4_8_14_3_um_filter_31_8]PIY16281.1 MAG: hypothetical protein COZ16_00530 [Flavobacteriaceae bacterium CG_4_10_14_3_um_filter_31_253]PIZ11942.1 MAG: hypothetical protein COY55_02345 [Flavobacteriaceae bacterium CG_4_1
MISKSGFCQLISGFISESSEEKMPFANVYFKNTKLGISSDNIGLRKVKKKLLFWKILLKKFC